MFLGNLKYRQKVLVLLALVFVFVSIGLYIVYRVSYTGFLRDHAERLRAASRLSDELMRRKTEDLRRLVNIVQSDRSLIEYLYIASVLGGDKEPLINLIKPMYVLEKVDVLLLYDMDGRVIVSLSTKDGPGGAGTYKGPLPKVILSGFTEIGGHVLTVGVGPLRYGGGTIGHVVLGKYIDGELLGEISDIAGGELLFVRGGDIIASSLGNGLITFEPGGEKLRLRERVYSLSETQIKGLGAEALGRAYKPLGGLVTAVPDEPLHASLSGLRQYIYLTLGASFAISIGLGLLLIKALVSPLGKIVEFVEGVGKGEFDRTLEIKGRDEAAKLSVKFNEMQKELKAKRDALNLYAGGLEKVIIERTKELEEAQRQLLQAQKMKSLGTLAGGVAHDFNNLLSAILGYASFLKEELDESHPHYKYWDIIEHAALRGTELTNRLLTFSRGSTEPREKEPVEMNGLLRELIALLDKTLDKTITLSERLSDERLYVKGDPSALFQAVLNLCVNAKDAMPEGGTLAIESMSFWAGEDFLIGHYQAKAGSYAQINVTDTGIGMDRETLDRIFEPFFTTKAPGRGTGLGLAITYSVVREHGGIIDVYSEPGHGSTFKLYFPVSGEVGAAVEEEIQRLEADTAGAMVLVVDDEEPLRKLSKEILESAKYNVIIASDGEEAVRLFEENKGVVKLVILDLIMPGLGGHDTYKRIRAIDPSVKVLLSSGFSRAVGLGWTREKGVAGFIEKPFRVRVLLRRVKEALASA